MKGKNRENVLNSSMVMVGKVVLLLSLAFVLLPTPAAAEPVKVWVNAPEYIAEGATFDVTIRMNKVENFMAGQFDLSFNSSVVVVTDVEDGYLNLGYYLTGTTLPVDRWEFIDKDTIRVMIDISEVTGVSGFGCLSRLKLRVKGKEEDRSMLNLSNVFLYNNKGEEIPANWSGDLVTVVIPEVKVKVNAPEYVEVGETFVATIDVDNLTNFTSGMFDLSFNSSVVVITDVEDGRLDEETIPVERWAFMDEDTIRVLLEIPGLTVVNGSGYLTKIRFQAVCEEGDESVLDLSNGELICFNFTDSKITPEAIPAEWIDAEVRIVKGEPEPTPTPPTSTPVHNLNTSENFSSIQAAIDDTNTKDGHVIEVDDGVYYENVDVTKSLTISSRNGPANCIIKAAKADDNVFEVIVDYACIKGFTVKGALAMGKAGIYLNASYCNVSNNNCSNSYCGIHLEGSSNNTVSNNNCFLNNEEGISLYDSSNNTLSDNNCSSNKWAGICLHNSSNNTILDNNLSNNLDGIHLQSSSNNTLADNRCSSNGNGISFWHSRSSILSNNNCSSNSDYGIHLYESSDNNVISDNTCSSNGNGIALSDSNNNNISTNNCSLNDIGIHLWLLSNNNAISNNTCFSSTNIGIRIYESSNNSLTCNNCSNNGYGIYLFGINNKIYLNNFISNTNNVHSVYPNNIWNSAQKINYIYNGSSYTNYMGNYWSDYNGSDADGDGIGDTPYRIESDEDGYPLMEPWGNYFTPTENIF